MLDAATGLNYMQQRYYDPQIGLFLSVDPVTAYANPVGQFHRYRYANNNPFKFTDPDGRRVVSRTEAQQPRIEQTINAQSETRYKFNDSGELQSTQQCNITPESSQTYSAAIDPAD